MPKMHAPDHLPPLPNPAGVSKTVAAQYKPVPPDASKPEPAFYTVPQLAGRWAISERQLHRFIKDKVVTATRFGRSVRVSAEEVARFEAERFGVD